MNLKNNNIIRVAVFVMATFLLFSCGNNNVVKQDVIVSEFDENVFKAVTWNLQEFPLANNNTLNQLQIIIPELNADIIAVQEVTDTDRFVELGNLLNDYEVTYSYPYVYQVGSYFNPVLGYIYNKNRVQVNSRYKIFPDDRR